MRLTVLGRHGLYPPRGGACSSFLVTTDEGRGILLDCGPGSLARWPKEVLKSLDAVVLTHLHWDHVSDALPLRYALERTGHKITMYLPKEPREIAGFLTASDLIEPCYIEEGMTAQREGCRLSFVGMRHPLPAYGVRVEDGGVIAYSGDTNICAGLAALLANGPDIALVDACFTDAQWAEGKPHLSARLAAEAMRDAGVKLPLLTHLPPDGDMEALLREAQAVCPAARWAVEGAAYDPHG